MKKNLSSLLVVFMIFCTFLIKPITAYADTDFEDPQKRSSPCINSYFIGVTPIGGGRLSVESNVSAVNSGSFTIDMVLEVYENGKWSTVSSWNKSGSGYYLADSRTYNGKSGKQYRAMAYFTARVGSYSDAKNSSCSPITAY